jgi:uroporphyrinogen-III synthase
VPDFADPRRALAGAAIVVTRPAGTSAALAARVRAMGGSPVLLPGLALRATDRPDAAIRALRGLRAADIVLFTSPAAVRFAFALLPALRVSRRAVAVAVGTGTAHALARRGIAAVVPRRADSEGVLALPALARVRGLGVALVGAPGGRDLIAPALRRRGARVERIDVYHRVPPRWTRRHLDALATAPDPLITLLSSGEAMTHLVALLPPPLLARLRRAWLVVSSERLATAARAHGSDRIAVARSAAPGDLLAAAAEVRAGLRR